MSHSDIRESDWYDAIVVGAGPAGSTAALLLAQAGWRVAIVEASCFPRRKVCGEFISWGTWPLLHSVGVARRLIVDAGPAVRRVAIFNGGRSIAAPLPAAAGDSIAQERVLVNTPGLGTGRTGRVAGDASFRAVGRAVGRDVLDASLLQRAVAAGAEPFQPARLIGYAEDADAAWCMISGPETAESARATHCAMTGDATPFAITARGSQPTRTLRGRVVIAAHGSWMPGPMRTQQFALPNRGGDLLGFKAHLTGVALAADLMPLLSFPGGYGGLVATGAGRVSLSCCVRRDALTAIRKRHRGRRAGDAIRAHIAEHCAPFRDALAAAHVDGAWLAAGPMRTGIRGFGCGRIIAVGNAAAEAHPIVAEGISMAIQSAHLACGFLAQLGTPAMSRRHSPFDVHSLALVRSAYARAWRRQFARRVHAAAFLAHVFMRPSTARIAASIAAGLPPLLTFGAHLSGKDAVLGSAVPAPSASNDG